MDRVFCLRVSAGETLRISSGAPKAGSNRKWKHFPTPDLSGCVNSLPKFHLGKCRWKNNQNHRFLRLEVTSFGPNPSLYKETKAQGEDTTKITQLVFGVGTEAEALPPSAGPIPELPGAECMRVWEQPLRRWLPVFGHVPTAPCPHMSYCLSSYSPCFFLVHLCLA